MKGDAKHMTFFSFFCKFVLVLVFLLLSARNDRFSVSLMRDFYGSRIVPYCVYFLTVLIIPFKKVLGPSDQ